VLGCCGGTPRTIALGLVGRDTVMRRRHAARTLAASGEAQDPLSTYLPTVAHGKRTPRGPSGGRPSSWRIHGLIRPPSAKETQPVGAEQHRTLAAGAAHPLPIEVRAPEVAEGSQGNRWPANSSRQAHGGRTMVMLPFSPRARLFLESLDGRGSVSGLAARCVRLDTPTETVQDQVAPLTGPRALLERSRRPSGMPLAGLT
jgi:hypothetical protein